jgi:hypothetical protein
MPSLLIDKYMRQQQERRHDRLSGVKRGRSTCYYDGMLKIGGQHAQSWRRSARYWDMEVMPRVQQIAYDMPRRTHMVW